MARALLFPEPMRNYPTTLFGFTCAAALIVGACGSDSNDDVTDEDYDQVAQSLGAATAARGDVAAITLANDLALGALPLGISFEGSGRYQGNFLGLSYELAIECRDASGQVMLLCNGDSVSASVSTAWSGTLSLPRLEASASRTGTLELDGLQDELLTVNGSAHFDLMSEFSSASNQNHKTLDLSYDASYDAVLVDTTTSTFVDGEIHFVVNGERTHTTPGMADARSFEIDATISFAADGTYTLVLDGDRTYSVDASTGAVVHVGTAN